VKPASAAGIASLQGALAAEHAAVYGYGVVGAMLSGGQESLARADWLAHQQARDSLEAMLVKLGATPVAASPAYQLPFPVTGEASAVRLAAALEDGVTQAYLVLVAVTDRALRSFGALSMQPPANRAVAWRGTTVAFPGMPTGLVAAAGEGEDSCDGSDGGVQVVGDGDPLRPGPPEPPESVLAPVGVDVLLERPRGRVRDVHARYPTRGRHQPGLEASISKFLGQLVEVDSCRSVIAVGFHRTSPLLIVVFPGLSVSIVSGCRYPADRATRLATMPG
jgi:Domain of unknown function (DUF4439)